MKNRKYWEERMVLHFLKAEQEKNRTAKELKKALSKASEAIGDDFEYYMGKYSKVGEKGLEVNLEAVLDKIDKMDNYKEWEYYRKKYPKYFYAKQKSKRFTVERPKTVRDALRNKTMNRTIDAGEIVLEKGTALFSKVYVDTYRKVQKDFGVKAVLVDIDKDQLKKTIESKWIGDAGFSERLWKDTNDIAKRTFSIMEDAIIQGKDPKWIKKVLKEEFEGQPQHVVNRLVNTELKRINTEASYNALNDLDTEYYEISAVLDSRTSKTCRGLHGEKFKMKDFKIGENAPPFHPNCRSVIVPVD